MKEIHASWISDYKTCPRLYYFRNVEGLVPKDPDPKLFLGTGVHKALQCFYGTGMDDTAAQCTYEEWAEKELDRVAPNVGPEKLRELEDDIALGRAMLEAYFPWAQDKDDFVVLRDEDGLPLIEREFSVPIYYPLSNRKVRNVRHVGRLDGVVQDVYGRVWLLEHKTASQFPDELTLQLDDQVGCYLLAANYLFPQFRVAGVLYNVLRKVNPARARGEIFGRYKILFNDYQIRRYRWRLWRASRRMLKDTEWEPSPGLHCSWKCGYQSLCLAFEDGTGVEELVEALYTRKEVIPCPA